MFLFYVLLKLFQKRGLYSKGDIIPGGHYLRRYGMSWRNTMRTNSFWSCILIWRHRMCGFFFLWLLFYRYQVVTKNSSNDVFFQSKWRLRTKWHRVSEKFIILNTKRCHLITFSSRLKSERRRARRKRNHKFRA